MTSIGPLHEEIDQEQREKELEREQRETQPDTTKEAEKKYDRKGRRILFAAEKGRLFELLHYIREDPRLANFADTDGYTPLHRASYGGHKDCAKYLIKHGANLEARTNDLWTPLHCAVRWNNLLVAEFLIKKGADVNAQSDGGNTPLHIAASNGRYSITCDIIQLLLFHPNCDHTIKNNSGDTAYDIARRSGPFYKLWVGVETIFPQDYQAAKSTGVVT